MTIKERVQTILRIKGISAQKLEEDLGFAKGYVSKLDKTSPSSDKIAKIADYLDVSIDYLITGKEKDLILTPDEKEFIEMLKLADPESREFAKHVLEKGQLDSSLRQ